MIKNEYAQGAAGEISPFDSWPELWVVNDSDFDPAMAIVKLSQQSNDSVEWSCKSCSETNASSFEIIGHISGFIFCCLGLISEAALMSGILMLATAYLYHGLIWHGDQYGIWYDHEPK